MNNYKKLTHTTWECKYHLVWIPKYRKKMLYGNLRKYIKRQDEIDQKNEQLELF